jgi:alanyl-tRNA synthetase
VPLPKPSVDTGLGLERTTTIIQGVESNYHTDVFLPLLQSIEEATGVPYRGRESREAAWHVLKPSSRSAWSAAVKDGGRVLVDPAAFRVIADHARAVAFLLADGVFPSNEGRGYVLRRILRRAVRHAWLMGRATPMLSLIVERVIDSLGDVYPELTQRRKHIVDTTLAEEQRFLATIDGGMKRFDEIAPLETTQGSDAVRGTISGEDAFRLYDTFGFPIDLTELMARERGYTVDIAGFEQALSAQRAQSQEERKSKKIGVSADQLSQASWQSGDDNGVDFVGYDRTETDTSVVSFAPLTDSRVAVMLRETPFYAESGGQISDNGVITGDGWKVDVDEVRKIDGRVAAIGKAEGNVKLGPAHAVVPRNVRLDTERNHTATHLLHAALRKVLGDHVHQAGSLVAPDRLRFDFTHHGPLSDDERNRIEEMVNKEIFEAIRLDIRQKKFADARAEGAMALFGEKYGDVVRVVSIPGVSAELCGGTHVRNTSEIGLFRIVAESGIAAGVRRIEAITGPKAYALLDGFAKTVDDVAEIVRSSPDMVVKKIQSLVDERKSLEKRVEEAMRTSAGDEVTRVLDAAEQVDGIRVIAARVAAADMKSLTTLADAVRDKLPGGVAVLAAEVNGKHTLVCVVTDDVRERGLRADTILKTVAAVAGGRGGGKPHLAQAGIPDGSRIDEALHSVVPTVRRMIGNNGH